MLRFGNKWIPSPPPAATYRYSIKPQLNPETSDKITLIYPRDPIPAPAVGAILIGEVCYNLRSALDYLVFELAQKNSGRRQSGTQFPIEFTAKKFEGRKETFLKGVDPRHVAMIERLQPYSGCEWTKHLAGFSNRDKHNEFVGVGARAIIETNPVSPHSPRTYIFRATHPVTGVEMNVNIHVSVEMMLGDKLPVVETLEKIKAGVAQTLADFHPELA